MADAEDKATKHAYEVTQDNQGKLARLIDSITTDLGCEGYTHDEQMQINSALTMDVEVSLQNSLAAALLDVLEKRAERECEVTIEFTLLIRDIEDLNRIKVPEFKTEGFLTDEVITKVTLDGKELNNPEVVDGILTWGRK